MQSRSATHPEDLGESKRYEALLEMADLMVCHKTMSELFHDMALGLRKVADLQFLNFSLHNPQHKIMQLHWWEGEKGNPVTDLPVETSLRRVPVGGPGKSSKSCCFAICRRSGAFPWFWIRCARRGFVLTT